jgi:putative tryptophan/tyrosine transport system substrate-binding protein
VNRTSRLARSILTLIALAIPLVDAYAADIPRTPRIGVLYVGMSSNAFDDGLREGLGESGYREGENISIDWRRTANPDEELQRLSKELASANVDVMVAPGNAASRAALSATSVIPVVFVSGDPVTAGFASNLAHPTANGTGLYVPSPELEAKRLELLKQLVPTARRIAYLRNSSNPLAARHLEEVQGAAMRLSLQVLSIDVHTSQELNPALAGLTKKRMDAVLVGGDPVFMANAVKVTRAVREARLPASFPWREYHDHGALISYGLSAREMGRKAAFYVSRILKGAKPVDLPVEQAAKFELIIDLREARALGVDVPQEMLLRADQVLQ